MMSPTHLVVLCVTIGIGLLAGTVRSVRQSLIRRPISEFRPFSIALIQSIEWLLWIAGLLGLLIALPHPTTPVLLTVFFASCITATQFAYREESWSLNQSLAIASNSNTSIVKLIDSFATGCRSRISLQAKRCVLRMNRGEALVDAARRSKLPIDADILAAIATPMHAVSESKSMRINVDERESEFLDPTTIRQLTYVVMTLLLAWSLASLVRSTTTRVFEAMRSEFDLASWLEFTGMSVVVPLGNAVVFVVVIWCIAAFLIRHLPIWMVRWVPWFGTHAIHRWRCTAIRSIGYGMAGDHSPQQLFALTAKSTRIRWIRKQCSVAETMAGDGVDLPMTMRKAKLITKREQSWLTAAQSNGNLPTVMIQLTNQIARRQRLRWQIRMAWLVPVATVLIGIFVLSHALHVFNALYGMVGGLA